MRMNLCIGIPSGYKQMYTETAIWLAQCTAELAARAKHISDEFGLELCSTQSPRIALMRNLLVEMARERGATHLLMVDPDMLPDRFLREKNGKPLNRYRPFVWEAIKFAATHPQSVLAAPYHGQQPSGSVCHVFARNEAGELRRLPKPEAERLRGWQRVDAVGTGLMLLDMKLFDVLEPPYFFDEYKDAKQTTLLHSQDVAFCLKCGKAGVPTYVNFDCWAGHYQEKIVVPEFEEPQLPKIDPRVPVVTVKGNGDLGWK